MNKELLAKLLEIKKDLKEKGVIILGVVGSVARGEERKDSDIDLLYSVDYEKFLSNYKGFDSFLELENIKKELEKRLGKKVDLINNTALSKTAKKYLIKDLIEF